MDPITSADYWKEISELAADMVHEVADEIAAENEDDARDRLSDLTHETVDGHQWIIYTYYNQQVLQHTRNEDAFADCGLTSPDSFSAITLQCAFWAMRQDLSEEVDTQLTAAIELAEAQREAAETVEAS